jgi:hypothetical protein
MEEFQRKISTSSGLLCDVCLGIYKHGKFAPHKARELGCPPITEKDLIDTKKMG